MGEYTLNEVWKKFIFNYEISNLGRLKNTKTNKILKSTTDSNGYLGITISLGSRNKIKRVRIHRLVAEAFIPNPNNLPQVNHIDGNKQNNKVDNLEWCDNRYNQLHAIDLGLKTFLKKENNPRSKLTEQDVDFILKHYKPRDPNYGTRGLARKFNVHHETIRQVLNKETWK